MEAGQCRMCIATFNVLPLIISPRRLQNGAAIGMIFGPCGCLFVIWNTNDIIIILLTLITINNTPLLHLCAIPAHPAYLEQSCLPDWISISALIGMKEVETAWRTFGLSY